MLTLIFSTCQNWKEGYYMKEVHLYQRLLLSTDWQKKLQLPFIGFH